MKNILLLLLFISTFSMISAQSPIEGQLILGCKTFCEVEKTIQKDALLGIKIINYHQDRGAMVLEVLDHTAAEKYSFQKVDVILAVDTIAITSMKHLVQIIQSHQPSDVVSIKYLRRDETFDVDVVLGAKSTTIVKQTVCCEYEDKFFNDSNITMYPNPSISEIKVSMEEANKGKYVFQVFDITGKRIITQVSDFNSSFTNTIDIRDIPNGDYYLKLTKGENSFTKSFIKQD